MSNHGNTPTRQPAARRRWRTAVGVATLAVVGVLAACSDAPSAPGAASVGPAAPSFAKGLKGGKFGQTLDSVWAGQQLASPVLATSLKRNQPLADTISASFPVTRAGGTFTVAGTGLQIEVPKNAVKDDFVMTVKALPGNVVAYEFGPHGLQFKKSLILGQDLSGTDYARLGIASFDAGYFASLGDVDGAKGTALVKEKLQNSFDAESRMFYFAVNHFSGYMVSWGFRGGWDSDAW